MEVQNNLQQWSEWIFEKQNHDNFDIAVLCGVILNIDVESVLVVENNDDPDNILIMAKVIFCAPKSNEEIARMAPRFLKRPKSPEEIQDLTEMKECL